MMTAELTISRLRRGLTVTAAVKAMLIGGALVCLVAIPGLDSAVVVTVFLTAWLFLSFKSAKSSRLVADSPALISLGRYEEAEASLDQAMGSFSMFRTVKLLSLHHLAVLRHKQRRWADAAKLSQALLQQRLGGLANLKQASQLMLADSLLNLGDVRGAYQALAALYNHRLSLAEATRLMALQLDYELRVGAFQSAATGLAHKLELCELLPAAESAKAQAMLALAAKKTGHDDWSRYLRQRVQILADVNELLAQKPMLREVLAD